MFYQATVLSIAVMLCLTTATHLDAQTASSATGRVNSGPESLSRDIEPVRFADRWQLGKPDLVVSMPRPFQVPADGPDFARCFVLPLNLPAGAWVRAVEFRPGNPRVVRHALLFPDAAHSARTLQARSSAYGFAPGDGPGMTAIDPFGDWVPGALPGFLIPGVARALKPGTDLVLLTHFHPDGRLESEQSSVGIYLSRAPSPRVFAVVPLNGDRNFVRSGVKEYQVRASFTLPVDVAAVGILPHARSSCSRIQSYATLPNGHRKPLLWIDGWSYERPDAYRYRVPIDLPAGTRLSAEFTYDNSAENPHRATNTPLFVTWGASPMEEIAGQWLQVVLKRPEDRARLAHAVAAATRPPTAHNPANLQGAYRFRIWERQHPFNGDYTPHPDLGVRRVSAAPPPFGATDREEREYLAPVHH
jgi:hypothetical protein